MSCNAMIAGRRGTANRHIEFFERRLALDAENREEAEGQEERHLVLQERQLQLDSDLHSHEVCEFQEVHE
ncbi:hypothetical protein MTO96_017917 [Rhipicephalus appendiculatus]